jgi:UDP-2-acetamido-3-amino-2,3-dideoxy-glucuronate N-acetyltransferase
MSDSTLTYFKHPAALVESSDIGNGTRIWALAHVMEGARIGSGCNICDHVFVESNVVIGNRVTVKNGVALWGGIVLDDCVFVGPFATFTNDKNPRAAIRKSRDEYLATRVRMGLRLAPTLLLVCGITVGCYAFVGAGALVIKDVADYAIVVGNPARAAGYMCECGRKLPTSLTCGCGKVYERCGRAILPAAEPTSDSVFA